MDSEEEAFEDEGWDEARAGDAVSVSRRTQHGGGARPPTRCRTFTEPMDSEGSEDSSGGSAASSSAEEGEPEVPPGRRGQGTGEGNDLVAPINDLVAPIPGALALRKTTLGEAGALTRQPRREPEPEPEESDACAYLRGVRGACRRCSLHEEHLNHVAMRGWKAVRQSLEPAAAAAATVPPPMQDVRLLYTPSIVHFYHCRRFRHPFWHCL